MMIMMKLQQKLTSFRIQFLNSIRRGTNELQIENDCWYAVPDNQMQRDLEAGKLVGDMIKGIIPNPKVRLARASGALPSLSWVIRAVSFGCSSRFLK